MILHELRLFFIALQFFTRLPVPRWVGYEPEWLHQSARHFPAVGAVVGGVGSAVLWAGLWLFPLPVAVGLSMAATVLLTGAFHEDGLADTCDGLGGAVSRERALEIMKDSRIGSYGAVGLLLVLGLKAAALTSMNAPMVFAALVFAHTASRAAAVSLIRWLPYAGDVAHAKAKPLAQRVSAAGFAVAWGWVLVMGLVLVAWRPAWWPMVLLGLVTALVGAVGCALWLRRRLGGTTGDTLGATQQLSELLVLLGYLAWLRA
ncbi:MAG TPA: adenosylcobinamide-GDP ribazoletransferase [Rhizobacter sp.]|nr:adenosylcobinamide-GDP ribazoletransferase [Rhizobacter sp.]